ncbi:MAG: protease modulator HflK [Lentisphaeria bacterium]|nr:protease modulator HflK [Lentisphaeria bacterium]
MANQNDFKFAAENAGKMTKMAIWALITAFVLFMTVYIGGVVKWEFAKSFTFVVAMVPFAVAAVFSIGAIFAGIFGRLAASENVEKILLEKRKNISGNMFDVNEDVRFTAGRTFSRYTTIAPYILSVIGIMIVFGLSILVQKRWIFSKTLDMVNMLPANPLHAAVVALIVMLVALFFGAFLIGQARVPDFRWLRPVGAWLMVGFGGMLLASVVEIYANITKLSIDQYCFYISFWVYMVLGAELVINFIVEFYRPRTGGDAKLVFESRLLALFTEPGGIMRNVADALDYQFGFKVSGTWVYSFIERAIFPFIIIWALIAWLTTCISNVGPSEVGVRERFGRFVSAEPLPPGVYFNLPWPFEKISTFSCEKIYTVVVGAAEHDDEEGEEADDDGHGHAKAKKPEVDTSIIQWGVGHGHDEMTFMVANKSTSADFSGAVSLMGLNIPVEYRIRQNGVLDYAYRNTNTADMLRDVSLRVAIEYFASVDFMEVISNGRSQAELEIANRIQSTADRLGFGVEILGVYLNDVHPPKDVVPKFHEVVASLQRSQKAIIEANTYRFTTVEEAKSAAFGLEEGAKADSNRAQVVAKAEALRFDEQLKSYKAFPAYYKERNYLQLLENDCADMRKIVISKSLKEMIYELNLERKIDFSQISLSGGESGGLISEK